MRNRLIFAALVVAGASPSFGQQPEQAPVPPPSSPPQGISSAPAERTESTPPSSPAGTEPQRRWSSFLPLLADEARKRGLDLPLPFGVSLVYYRLSRDIKITDVRIGQGGNPPTSVSQVASFSSRSDVSTVVAKLDAWLFPFLNLYALVGWFHNDSTTHVGVSIPSPIPGRPPTERELDVKTAIDGSVGGLGMTLATGYPPFFLVLDVNVFRSDLGFSETLRGSIGSARAGWAGSVARMPFNAWLSATYWNTAATVKDQLSDPELGMITFEADQGPRFPWTFGLGANLRVHPHFEIFTEGGTDFRNGWYFVLGPTARL
jgi:hypothetical protein